MTSRSGTGEERPQLESETSGSLAEGCESTRNEPSRLESRTSRSQACTLTVGFEAWLLLYRLTHFAGQHPNARRLPRMCGAAAKKQTRGSATACVLFLSLCNVYGRERGTGCYKYETHFSTVSEIANDDVGIRATNVALGLRRLPSGFYAVLHHSGLEWRTENKPSSANDDVVEWSGPIPM